MPIIQPAEPGQGKLLPVTGHYVVEYLEALKKRAVRVYRVTKTASGEYHAEAIDPSAVLGLSGAERDQKHFLVERDWMSQAFAETDRMDTLLAPLVRLDPQERSRAVSALKTALAELKVKKAEPEAKARVIMDTVSQVFLLNKASLKLKVSDVTIHEKTLARDTDAIMGTALEFAEDPALMAGLFSCFQDLSNGQTINHVLRVFTSYTSFLRRYQGWHQAGLSRNLRKVFPSVYRRTYDALLPGLEDRLMTSDQVLQLSDLGFLDQKEFTLGAFLHDIGKMGNIDYFESDLAYDAEQIQQHVFLGAGLILMNYGNSHDGARMMAGDHHNALGHPGGYGLTRLERERGMRKSVPTLRVLGSDSRSFVSGESLGWLPVEMLAVVDVYDAMTDNSRSYKKGMTPAQAVVFLEETMAASGKLDPLLVDLYIDELRLRGVDVPPDRGYAFKTKA